MFGRKKEKTAEAVSTSYEIEASPVDSLIAAGVILDGPMTSSASLRLDGRINGNVRVDGTLIVGRNGYIGGDVKTTNLFLAGEIHGNIDASSGRIEISESGKAFGDIETCSIVMDENATLTGNCRMRQGLTSASAALGRTLTSGRTQS